MPCSAQPAAGWVPRDRADACRAARAQNNEWACPDELALPAAPSQQTANELAGLTCRAGAHATDVSSFIRVDAAAAGAADAALDLPVAADSADDPAPDDLFEGDLLPRALANALAKPLAPPRRPSPLVAAALQPARAPARAHTLALAHAPTTPALAGNPQARGPNQAPLAAVSQGAPLPGWPRSQVPAHALPRSPAVTQGRDPASHSRGTPARPVAPLRRALRQTLRSERRVPGPEDSETAAGQPLGGPRQGPGAPAGAGGARARELLPDADFDEAAWDDFDIDPEPLYGQGPKPYHLEPYPEALDRAQPEGRVQQALAEARDRGGGTLAAAGQPGEPAVGEAGAARVAHTVDGQPPRDGAGGEPASSVHGQLDPPEDRLGERASGAGSAPGRPALARPGPAESAAGTTLRPRQDPAPPRLPPAVSKAGWGLLLPRDRQGDAGGPAPAAPPADPPASRSGWGIRLPSAPRGEQGGVEGGQGRVAGGGGGEVDVAPPAGGRAAAPAPFLSHSGWGLYLPRGPPAGAQAPGDPALGQARAGGSRTGGMLPTSAHHLNFVLKIISHKCLSKFCGRQGCERATQACHAGTAQSKPGSAPASCALVKCACWCRGAGVNMVAGMAA